MSTPTDRMENKKNGGNVLTNTRANEMGREKKSTVDERQIKIEPFSWRHESAVNVDSAEMHSISCGWVLAGKRCLHLKIIEISLM